MTAYYNEIDDYAARWLRNLIRAGHIAPGVVDTRSILDVHPRDLDGFTQCHFFAGIGIWSAALRTAGWPDDRPVWTGSCPCQPFSAAGKGAGFDDERHLWPAWHHLIRQCRPIDILGEQVASPDGYKWLDLVQTDMEAAAHAFGTIVLPAAGVGAPHGRHRIWFVAHPRSSRRNAGLARDHGTEASAQPGRHDADRRGSAGHLADANSGRPGARAGHGAAGHGTAEQLLDHHCGTGALAHTGGAGAARLGEHGGQAQAEGLPAGSSVGGSVGNAGGTRGGGNARAVHGPQGQGQGQGRGAGHVADLAGASGADGILDDAAEQGLAIGGHDQIGGRAVEAWPAARGAGPVNGFWADAEWVLCRDPKGPRWRPIEPGTFPVASGVDNRVGRLRAYGNGINRQAAAAIIQAYMSVRP